MSDKKICKHCGSEITPNAGRFPKRGPWLDSVDWSVCDWTYRNHEPKEEAPPVSDNVREQTEVMELRKRVIVTAEETLGDQEATDLALQAYEEKLANYVENQMRQRSTTPE